MTSAPRRRPRRTIDTAAFLAGAARMLAAGGRRAADGDPEDLAALLKLRDELDEAILEAVRGLRAGGTSWQDIGDAVGTTRQAAIMRWNPKL